MAITAKKTDKEFELCPAGTHTARCYMVADLGRQKVTWQGQDKIQHKVLIGFELPEEAMSDGRPFAVSGKYTLSLSEKAALRGLLESWRGVPFSQEEANGFDITKLLSAPCMLTIVHNKSGDKTYANIASIAKLHKSVTCPAQVNPSIEFSFENFSEEKLSKLPEWVQKMVKQSLDYPNGEPEANHPAVSTPPRGGEFDDDIPFAQYEKGFIG